MKEATKELLETFRKEVCEKILAIGETITDYFGEENVDVQLDSIEQIAPALFNSDYQLYRILSRTTTDNVVTLTVPISNNTIQVPLEQWNNVRQTHLLEAEEPYRTLLAPLMKREIERYYRSHSTTIIIKFPEVNVTNEHDASCTIKDLYARIKVNVEGRLVEYFKLLRANYLASHYLSGYAHSHLPGIHFEFIEPCLGTGPVGFTQSRLHQEYDIDRYGLFCYELAKYVTVESLDGVPYRRLENIGQTTRRTINFGSVRYRYIQEEGPVQDFIKYYIRTQEFPVAFVDGAYTLGMPMLDFIVQISKCFIDWYNKQRAVGLYTYDLVDLKSLDILGDFIIDNKVLYRPTNNSGVPASIETANGRHLFDFKGAPVTLTIVDDRGEEITTNYTVLLCHDTVNAIIKRCLRVINYNYGQKDETSAEGRRQYF